MRMEAHPGFSPKPLPETQGVKVRNWREGKDLADISLAEAMKGCGYVGRGRRGWWRRASMAASSRRIISLEYTSF